MSIHFSEEDYKNYLKNKKQKKNTVPHKEKETDIQNLTQEKVNLETQVSRLEDEVSTLKENSSELTEITNSTKEEAKRLYKLANGENADDNIISLFYLYYIKLSQHSDSSF